MTRDELKPSAKIIRDACPGDIIKGRPVWDWATLRVNKWHTIIGCRGITCKECWNKEVKK